MRRRSPEVRQANELLGPPRGPEGPFDTEHVIRTLEPFVTIERRRRLLDVIDARLSSVTVLMDDPYDPHNGAAVLRSCDAFGIQRLHVIERRQPFAVATTVARGSEKWVDLVRHRSTEEALADLASTGHELIATDPAGELTPRDLSSAGPMAIVLGNERSGIAPDLRDHCSRAVRVPMRGFVESLNVSVCAAILLAHAVSGRAGDLPAGERRRLYARGLFLSVPRAVEMLAGQGRRGTMGGDTGS